MRLLQSCLPCRCPEKTIGDFHEVFQATLTQDAEQSGYRFSNIASERRFWMVCWLMRLRSVRMV